MNIFIMLSFITSLNASASVDAQSENTSARLQQAQVTGAITSATSEEALPGVNVIEKGTTNGVTTNLDGKFTITLQGENPVLVFSYMGFISEEIEVGTQTEINVMLIEDFTELEEIVVIGYGSVKKSDLTGSVGSLTEESITERSVNNPMEAIQGNIAGVTITSSTGRLGDPYKINIRGTNTLTNDASEVNGGTIGGTTQPLYIVDGVASDGIDYLNPQDIARMDVLKDASSTAIYGSRGSNGVIIVTTKSGANVKPGVNVSFDSYYGIKKAKELPDFMDGQTWWNFHQLAYTDDDLAGMSRGRLDTLAFNISEAYPAPYGQNRFLIQNAAANNTTDWADLVMQDGMMSNNYLSITGAGDKVSYNLGAGIQNETGLIQKEALDKYTLKAGFDSKVNKWFRVGSNITFAKTTQEQGSDRAMEDAFRLSPLMSPYDIDGETLFIQPGKLVDENGGAIVNKTSTWNPLLEIPNSSDLTQRTNLITSTYLQIKPLEWLTFKSTLSTGYDNRTRGQSWGPNTQTGHSKNDLTVGQSSISTYNSYTWDNQFDFDYTTSDENHVFNLLALQSIYQNVGQSNFAYSDNMPFETGFYNLSAGNQSSFLLAPQSNASYENDLKPFWRKERLSSFALRLNYSFKGKYLLTASSRWDGSSKLAEGSQWAAFPSIALGWRISEESFMKTQDVVSRLKLRASLGYTGNNRVDPYNSLNKLDRASYYSNYDFKNEEDISLSGWGSSSLASRLLTWEKTREFNLGLDYGILKNRISGSIDVYDRLSEGLIMTEKLPFESGWEEYNANVGSVSNKGIELNLTTVNVHTDKVYWETAFIFSKNVNKVVSIHGQSEKDDIGNNLFIGESVNAIYNYEFAGIVQPDQVNDPMFVEANLKEGMAYVNDISGPDGIPDGKLDEDDRTILGSSDPKWTGTINSRLTAFNFDFSFSILTYQGVLVNSPFHRNFIDLNDRGRQKLNVPYYVPANNVGLESNFSNEYPRPRKEGQFWKDGRIGNIKDASYTKIKNISLGYTIPESLLSKIRVKSFRLYVNIIDPFVFTKYDGYDPEWATASLKTGRVGYTTYQVGLNLKF